MIESMFHLGLPVAEKILRPMIVYLCLIVLLRIFGKRELAQLNPFDLVVLLSLSNTVQNAIIGNDNSVSGGVIGAVSLLAINWALSRLLFKAPKITKALEGTETVLIRRGKMIKKAMELEAMTEVDLLSVIHKQGLNSFAEVEKCILEPNGTFYVEAIIPSASDAQREEVLEEVRALSKDVKRLREMLETRATS